MHESSKPEHLLIDAVESLAKGRMTLVVLTKRWHRDNEDKAIRYAMEQIDRAGACLCGLQDIVEGASESTRQRSHSELPQVP